MSRPVITRDDPAEIERRRAEIDKERLALRGSTHSIRSTNSQFWKRDKSKDGRPKRQKSQRRYIDEAYE